MNHPLVSIHVGSCRYHEDLPPVLEKVSMDLHAGEFLLICGPSGEGKSTLLNILNGVIPGIIHACLEAEILLEGKPLQNMKAADRALLVGSVLQNADAQIVHDRVEDEVAFALENVGMDPNRMPGVIQRETTRMKLEPEWRTGSLSGGQKQRLVTAVTLAMGQRVLIFDEPLANLDHSGALLLLETLRSMARKSGIAIVFVEHRLDWVLPYADRVGWLEGRGLTMFGEVNDFSRFWQGRIGALSGERMQSSHSVDRKSEEALLLLKGAGCSLGKSPVLRQMDFSIHRGDKWIVLGDNGSGKTTFMKLLAGLLKPDKGIRGGLLAGGSIGKHGNRQGSQSLKSIGVVMQNPNYQLFMPTVVQEVAAGAVSDEVVESILEAFDLEALRERHPHSLSEGQKRKVGVAAILAMQPEVLLLDEPTVGQDDESLELLLSALRRFYQNVPLTMLTLTHDARCASLMGDRVLWMENGSIRASGGLELLDLYLAT